MVKNVFKVFPCIFEFMTFSAITPRILLSLIPSITRPIPLFFKVRKHGT